MTRGFDSLHLLHCDNNDLDSIKVIFLCHPHSVSQSPFQKSPGISRRFVQASLSLTQSPLRFFPNPELEPVITSASPQPIHSDFRSPCRHYPTSVGQPHPNRLLNRISLTSSRKMINFQNLPISSIELSLKQKPLRFPFPMKKTDGLRYHSPLRRQFLINRN